MAGWKEFLLRSFEDATDSFVTKHKCTKYIYTRINLNPTEEIEIDVIGTLGIAGNAIHLTSDSEFEIRFNDPSNSIIPVSAGETFSLDGFEITKIYLKNAATYGSAISIKVLLFG